MGKREVLELLHELFQDSYKDIEIGYNEDYGPICETLVDFDKLMKNIENALLKESLDNE